MGANKSEAGTPCAYCGRTDNLTKEHILPKFLYRRFPEQKTGYNARADKFMTWEPQIRDVCGECNNGPLATLDAQAQVLLERLRIERTYKGRDTIKFSYDWAVLTRWVLKVSYNSTRALGETPALLRQCVPYIREGSAAHPPFAFLAAEVVRDSPIPEERRHELPPEHRNRSHLPSRMFRVGPGLLHDPTIAEPPANHVLRFVALNAWYFTICIVEPEADRHARKRLAGSYRSLVPDAVLLKSHESAATVLVSRRTAVDVYELQGLSVQRQWIEYATSQLPKKSI